MKSPSPRFLPWRMVLRAGLWSVLLASIVSAPLLSQSLTTPSEATRKRVERTFDLLPIAFEPNQGQSISDAKFLARGRGFSALFKQNEADFVIRSRSTTSGLLRVTLLNASKDAAVSGESRLPGTVNYFAGNESEKWHTGLPTFERVRYARVYPGTDLIYYGNSGKLEFDFELSRGANPEDIQMRFAGARHLRINLKGDLIVSANDGDLSFQKPLIYQPQKNGRRDLVEGTYLISNADTVRFAVGRYDHSRPLIIDPILNYSTYIGPVADASSIAVDQNGEAYITGVATLDFPTTSGSYQPVGVPSSTESGLWPEGGKPFVAKFNGTGTALLYATFLSGSGLDAATGIALDASGDAYVVGTTSSTNFPTTLGVLQPTNSANGTTGFVAKLGSTGSSLLYSTYLGGSTSTRVNGVTVDGSGNAYVTGSTEDTNFPTTTGAYKSTAVTKVTVGASSAFVSKLNPNGTALIYSTYLGGNQGDSGSTVALDSTGEAYVGGNTSSNNFPLTQGAIQAAREASNQQSGFVAKFNASGSGLVYSTYLGGNQLDSVTSIALDSSGNAYATGSTNSSDFPITPGAFQSTIGISYFGYAETNAFVSELNGSGTSLLYSTFLGGGLTLGPNATEGDQATGIALDAQGMVYVTGMACTGDFPVTPGAFEPQNLDGEADAECTAFLTKLNPAPNTPLLYSTYLGGTGNGYALSVFWGEEANGIALDKFNNVYLAGFTNSVDFPVTSGVVETAFTGTATEAFVTEFNASEMKSQPIPTVTVTSNKSSVLFGQPVTFTATVTSSSGNTPTGYVGFNFYQQESSDDLGSGLGFGPWTTVAMNGPGVATFTTSSIELDPTQVNAFYLGDANNAPATGTMMQTLADIQTTTTVTSNQNNVPYGTAVTFTATVLDSTGKPVLGDVSFQLSYLSYAQVNLNSAGQATWTNGTGGPLLPVGTDTVTVDSYPYSVGYAQSSGSVAVTFTSLGTTPVPTFTPPAGTYTVPQQVTINDSNSTANLYYTTDGSTPVAYTSVPFVSGMTINVNSSETINAIAVIAGYSPSPVVSAPYIINIARDFSMSMAPASLYVSAGQTALTNVNISGINSFTGSVTLSCSGLPTGTTCGFAPASVTGTGTSALTVTSSATVARNVRPESNRFFPLIVCAVAIGCFGMRKRANWLLVVLVCALPLSVLGGCGGGGSTSTPTPTTSTYTVNVTGTSGSLSHSIPLTLTVTN